MICRPCKAAGLELTRGNAAEAMDLHVDCPELARQADLALSATDKAGSALCDCQHDLATALVGAEPERREAGA